MDYKHIAHCNDLRSLYNEIRINIIRINNQYCTRTLDENGEYALNLFGMFDDPSCELSSIIFLALQLEGIAEAFEDQPEIVHLRELERIAAVLEDKMKELP